MRQFQETDTIKRNRFVLNWIDKNKFNSLEEKRNLVKKYLEHTYAISKYQAFHGELYDEQLLQLKEFLK